MMEAVGRQELGTRTKYIIIEDGEQNYSSESSQTMPARPSKKVKQTHYRPGVAQRVPGSYCAQIS